MATENESDAVVNQAINFEQRGEWEQAISLYEDVAEKWPEQATYARNCIDRLRQRQETLPASSPYDHLPYYRKQGFFWLMYFLVPPVALVILLFGDVYYHKKGEIWSFGLVNRIIAGLLLLFWIYILVISVIEPVHH